MTWCSSLLLTLLVLMLSACQLTPDEGSLGRVLVSEVPTQRAALHQFAQLEPWLEQFDSEIRAGQLVQVRCVIPDEKAYDGYRQWQRLLLLPARGTVQEKDYVRISKHADPALSGKLFQYQATISDASALPFYLHSYRPGGTVFRELECRFGADGVPQAVEAGMAVQAWTLDFARAERARHQQFSDADFAAGRVGVGTCALRDIFGEYYYQPIWLFHVAEGSQIRKGDVVELRFGETESGGGVGHVSTMTRKLGRREDFVSNTNPLFTCR